MAPGVKANRSNQLQRVTPLKQNFDGRLVTIRRSLRPAADVNMSLWGGNNRVSDVFSSPFCSICEEIETLK